MSQTLTCPTCGPRPLQEFIATENRSGYSGVATGGHYGFHCRIWASRPGIVRATIEAEEHYLGPSHGVMQDHADKVVIEIALLPAFDPASDYLLVEHLSSPNPYLGGSSHRENYELLAGRMPAWADFPAAWRAWVSNREVQRSALEHIQRRIPEAAEAIEYALRKSAKGQIVSAWLAVAEIVEQQLGRPLDHQRIRGSGSWTAARAMPIRIAQAIGGWQEPTPRPVFARRDDWGAVCVADADGLRT